MAYVAVPFGWEDRPSTETPITAANLEAFGAHIIEQILALVGIGVVLYDDGWAARPDMRSVRWLGGDVSTPPPVGGEFGALDGVDEWVPASGEGA